MANICESQGSFFLDRYERDKYFVERVGDNSYILFRIIPAYVELKTSKLERYISDTGVTALPGCVVTKDYSPRHNQKRKNSGDTIDYDWDKDD